VPEPFLRDDAHRPDEPVRGPSALQSIPNIRYPADLPITARREEIVAAIRDHQVVVLAGETGSGKTTQLPKMCLEAMPEARGQIGCTQPRRVAAMSVSRRVAEELNVRWGAEVGCKMRFSDDTSRETRIKFMTDGILLAEIQSDPMLRAYAVLILDEAHERSLNIDFLLGYLAGLLKKRPNLKLLITSATIDTEAFSRAFGNAPIIEVSGRTYPVEIRYKACEEDEEDVGHVGAALAAVEEALIESDSGDVLVFMPTERDIRDARDLIEGRIGNGYEVLPLFGRMASAEQQRIFAPGRKRRVVIATNVAETSITIPRIRYVIDTGLARISRYNARTRTKRLPVEAVSQSSANQRAGRAGRVQDGVCIRLYSHQDFLKRDRFTMPEIQRANLAEVILRMKAFRLGDIETFPFINPPTHAAIRGGYELLRELGSLDDTHELTPLGHELAKLPLDPTLGRMLLQARREHVLPEMLIIASGLSIPDPRERPEEKREQAAAAHKAFAAPDSDFMSLWKIWQAAPDPLQRSRNALGKFCKANFLSFTRMTEWRDIWKQLSDSFADDLRAPAGAAPATPVEDRIHRCILAGQLGHIALKQERNLYKAGGNREVTIFPGSNLYERREKNAPRPKPGQDKSSQPAWIVAGEIVHTSQLFARTVAKVQPEWIAEIGAHLCQLKYSEPHWSAKAGRVLVTQRTMLHGLEVKRQLIDHGKVDPVAATELFIRGALIDHRDTPITLRFYAHNQALREKIETMLTRVRDNRVYALDERLFEFYRGRLDGISSIHDLNRLVNERSQEEPHFLCATEEELTAGQDFSCDLDLFPNEVALGNTVLPLTYQYRPGVEQDGVTVQVPMQVAAHLTSGQVQWMVPGLREEIAAVLMRALPKALRRSLMPIDQKAREVARDFDPGTNDFLTAFASFLRQRYRIEVKAGDWPPHSLPDHLQPRVEVLDHRQKTLYVGRDLAVVQASVKQQDVRSDAWEKILPRVERHALKSWSFGDLPEKIVVEQVAGVEVYGYFGLAAREHEVDLRLYRSKEEAAQASPGGVRRLAEIALGKDLAWLWKELRSGSAPRSQPASFQDALSQFSSAPAVKNSPEQLVQSAHEHILAHALRLEPLFPLTQARFTALCDQVRRELPALTHRVKTLAAQVQEQKQKLLALPRRYPGLEKDVNRLVPADVLAATPHAQLPHLSRFLRAIQVRNERWIAHTAKDEAKADLIADFDGWQSHVPASRHETFRWMLEEYRVQVFAPELGTAQPVSIKRLEALMADVART
jgi:ATP-dependent helicase HrpA